MSVVSLNLTRRAREESARAANRYLVERNARELAAVRASRLRRIWHDKRVWLLGGTIASLVCASIVIFATYHLNAFGSVNVAHVTRSVIGRVLQAETRQQTKPLSSEPEKLAKQRTDTSAYPATAAPHVNLQSQASEPPPVLPKPLSAAHPEMSAYVTREHRTNFENIEPPVATHIADRPIAVAGTVKKVVPVRKAAVPVTPNVPMASGGTQHRTEIHGPDMLPRSPSFVRSSVLDSPGTIDTPKAITPTSASQASTAATGFTIVGMPTDSIVLLKLAGDSTIRPVSVGQKLPNGETLKSVAPAEGLAATESRQLALGKN